MRKPDSLESPPGRTNRIAIAALFAVVAVACADTTASAPPPATAAATGKVAGEQEVAWAEMNKDQRIEYMKAVVVPRMKQAFTAFNPDRYAKMNCTPCHGDSAPDGSFKMPNPKLPVLPNSPDAFK